MSRKLLAILLSGTLACSAAAQSSSEGAVTFHVTSNLVVLDLVVTDAKGQVVSNLTKEDFTVFENKQPQAIKSFESIAEHRFPEASKGQLLVRSSADLKRIGSSPVTVLVLDELNTRFQDMAYGNYCLEKYLKRQPNTLDQPTTLIAVSSHRFEVLHDFTQDRDVLVQSLRKHIPEYPSQLLRTGNQGPGAGERMALAIEALEQIAKAQSGTPGRKNIVWVGKGFPTFNPARANEQSVSLVDTLLRHTIDIMLQARVALFVVDPAGVQAGTLAAAETPEELSAMEDALGDLSPYEGAFSFASFAPSTGGRSFLNRNDVDAEIASSIAEGANYYTVAYAPSDAENDPTKYRSIRVVLKRPGLHVMTRDGYFPPSAAGQQTTSGTPAIAAAKIEKAALRADLLNAAMGQMAYNGLTIGPPVAAGGVYHIALKVSQLQWAPRNDGHFQADLAVYLVAFDDHGKSVGKSGVAVKKMLSSIPSADDGTETVVNLPFTPQPNTERLRFVVRDNVAGKIGTFDLKTK